MDTCPLGAHSQPCWTHCKEACWLLTRQSSCQSPPLHLMPRSGMIWTSHPLNSRLDTFMNRYPGLSYPNALFEQLHSSFHLRSQEGGVAHNTECHLPVWFSCWGLQALAKNLFPMSLSLRKNKRGTETIKHQPLGKDKLPAEIKGVSGEEKVLILDYYSWKSHNTQSIIIQFQKASTYTE